MLSLSFSFFAIALLYATVGFGGGSSYIALLAVTGASYTVIPRVSLICNLLVVTGGCYQYYKNELFNRRLVLPLVLTSVPMAFLGGLYPIKEQFFFLLLALTLVLAGIRLLFINDRSVQELTPPSQVSLILVGGFLGLLSGIVGIGGGIFLSPIMLNLGWAKAKEAAAVASAFILLNSAAGLLGQVIKGDPIPHFVEYLPLFLAVVLGGQIGSRIGTYTKVPHLWVQRATAVLIIFVSSRLLMKIFI